MAEDTKPATSIEVRKMLNSISWYYKRTNALEIPKDLLEKLSQPLKEICNDYTG